MANLIAIWSLKTKVQEVIEMFYLWYSFLIFFGSITEVLFVALGNFLNTSRDHSDIFTPKSALSNRDGSNERSSFFKFKRQLHKSNLGNLSSEIVNYDTK